MAGERLVDIIQDAARKGIPQTSRTDLVWGRVLSVAPLQIQVENEPRLVLTDQFLKLSPLCLLKEIEIPIWRTDLANGPDSHSHRIPAHPKVVLWRALVVGDRVIMLRCANGNLFYVLQREGDL